jgi:hypothetical protein
MLDSARRKRLVPALARLLLGLGITATLVANVARGRVAGRRTGGLVRSPLLVIRSSQVRVDGRHEADPLKEQAAELFAEQLAADRVPSIRVIRPREHRPRLWRPVDLRPGPDDPAVCADGG